MAINYTSVKLVSGQAYKVSASNERIAGADGNETVVIAAKLWNCVISAAVEKVTLGVSLFNTRSYSQDGQLVVDVPWQGKVLTINPAASGTQLTYADGSVATIARASSGQVSMHYDTVYMPQNSSIRIPNGDVFVRGTTGTESLSISSDLRNVLVDASVEQVNIGMPYSSSLLVSSAGQLNVNNASGATVAKLSVANGHAETLSFNNAKGALALGPNGNATFTLTDLNLDANQAYTVAQSSLKIYGGGGVETVTLSNLAANVSIDARVEKVAFPSAFANYTYKTGTSFVQFFNASNTLVADVYVPKNLTGTQLQFANGTWTASYSNGVLGLSTNGSSSETIGTTNTNSANGLKYSVSWGNFSSSQSGVQACLNKAMANLGKYFNAKGSLDIQVLPETVANKVLAETTPTIIKTSASSESTVFQVESTSGVDKNGSNFDAVIYINVANLASLNLDPDKAPTAAQFDLTSILEHELLHAMGFTGRIGSSTNVTSSYDSLVRITNGTPYFVGTNAQALYGGPVPLTPASAGSGSAYYHVNVAGDLMSDAIGRGQVQTISKLDLAILHDIGAPVLVGVSPTALIT